MMRHHRRTLVRLAGWLMVLSAICSLPLLLSTSISAQQTAQLQGQVTDQTRGQVLASGRAQIDSALAELLQGQNVQLFVLFVDSTNGRPVTAYADDTARQNSLGGNDALLVVAVSDRTDAIWRSTPSLAQLTDRALQDVLTRRVEPLLARGDFPGAVAAGAQGIAGVAGTGSAQSQQPSSGGGAGFSRLLLPLLVGGGGLLLWRGRARRRTRTQAPPAQGQTTEQLAQQANTLLIAADETLRDAREEVGFAEAQFSEAEVSPYREAVAQASKELTAAFTLRQQLDDAEPEDAPTQRRMVEEMIARAKRVQALLEEQAQRIAQLRDLERTAPEMLAALPGQIDALEARIPAAEQTLRGLERYAERSRTSVNGNIEATRQRLAAARAATATGQQSLSSGDRAAAARNVRAAQQALVEGGRLLDAIESLAASLRQAEEAAGAQLAAAAADVQSARAALAASGAPAADARLAAADANLQQAERELRAERPDVLTATRMIAQADAAADGILAERRQEEERRAREQRLLAEQLQATEADYERVADFISARRRLIGSAARTRLAEAGRRLDHARALANADPAAAIAEARRVQDLTEDAYSRAVDDVEASQPYGGGWGGRMGGNVIFPIPFPIPMGGGGFGGGFGGGGMGGGFGGGGGGGGSVGGHW